MPADLIQRAEVVVGVVIAASLAIWRVVSSVVGLRRDVDENSRRIDKMEKDIQDSHQELKQDIYNFDKRAEAGRQRIEDKLDRLIERS